MASYLLPRSLPPPTSVARLKLILITHITCPHSDAPLFIAPLDLIYWNLIYAPGPEHNFCLLSQAEVVGVALHPLSGCPSRHPLIITCLLSLSLRIVSHEYNPCQAQDKWTATIYSQNQPFILNRLLLLPSLPSSLVGHVLGSISKEVP